MVWELQLPTSESPPSFPDLSPPLTDLADSN